VLMRLAAGVGLAVYGVGALALDRSAVSSGFGILSLATGMLLLVGLWTPVAGLLAAVTAGWHGFSNPAMWRCDILLGMLGVALALLGPGAWSIDACLFGWKRFEFRNGTATDASNRSGDDSSTD